MRHTLSLLTLTLPLAARSSLEYLSVCKEIAGAVSEASDVFYPGSFTFAKDVHHWASSSSAWSACSVEPGTAADVGIILQIVGKNRAAFAVKGGGHASNPGFSSTSGVHIAMYRFDGVEYDAAAGTATIGAGLIWDDVYAALEPHGVNVVGGRVTGVGVAGFTLGGGYSWLSNQYGLTVDTVVAYELVTPDGTVRTVTADDDDLFWALKGGGNNFGIVTKFTLKTFPQGQVWGGLITYTADKLAAVQDAVVKFNAINDTKAAVISAFNFLIGAPGVSQLIFYDGPTPPPGTFDMFTDIPHFTKDISTRSFLSLVKSSPANATQGTRAIFNTVTVPDYTADLMSAIVNETVNWGRSLSWDSGLFISYDVEPFARGYLQRERTSDSAFPPDRSAGVPLNIYYAWAFSGADDIMQDAARSSAARLQALVGSKKLPRYPNYSIMGTPLADMYGPGVDRLRSIAQTIDPDGVMSLAGGFKF